MVRRIVPFLVSAVLLAPMGAALAAEQPKPLYVQTIEKYPAPKLEDVGGREYKFLIDPAKTKGTPEEAFKDIWGQVKAAAAKNGFTVTEKEKGALKIELSTKEYFDTPEQAIWKKGYLIRLTNRYKDGKPDTSVQLTVKMIAPDANVVLSAALSVTGGSKPKTEAEENIGIGPNGQLQGVVEKGSSVTVPLADLGAMTIGDFGKFVPDLLKLGLPEGTQLVGTKAHSTRVRPGAVVLPGTEPCGVSMEAWAKTEGGAPYLYDFSYGYGDLDFYKVAETHAAGEKFLLKVCHGELAALAMPESDKWAGSKVRKLMNRPAGSDPVVTAPVVVKSAEKAAKPAEKAEAKAAKPVAGDPLDEKYGVASQPAYIKHYEADKNGKVVLNPYLQAATKDFPAVLDVKMAPYNWVMDAEGRVSITPEAAHPLGRTYEKGFYRPEDKSKRKPGTRENYGHVSALGGAAGRISGEILFDKDSKSWTINNKSGRYSKHNLDRTPEQLANAAGLIREVVDPAEATWGPVFYLLEYSSQAIQDQLMKNPNLAYDDPKTKSRPHIVIMAPAPSSFGGEKDFVASKLTPCAPAQVTPASAPKAIPAKADKAAAPKADKAVPAAAAIEVPKVDIAAPAADKPAKAKKPKAAQNDDPS